MQLSGKYLKYSIKLNEIMNNRPREENVMKQAAVSAQVKRMSAWRWEGLNRLANPLNLAHTGRKARVNSIYHYK